MLKPWDRYPSTLGWRASTIVELAQILNVNHIDLSTYLKHPRNPYIDLIWWITSSLTKETIKAYDLFSLYIHITSSLSVVGLVGKVSPSQMPFQRSLKIRAC